MTALLTELVAPGGSARSSKAALRATTLSAAPEVPSSGEDHASEPDAASGRASSHLRTPTGTMRSVQLALRVLPLSPFCLRARDPRPYDLRSEEPLRRLARRRRWNLIVINKGKFNWPGSR